MTTPPRPFQHRIEPLVKAGVLPSLPFHFATTLSRACPPGAQQEAVFAAAFVLAYRDLLGQQACLEVGTPEHIPASLADLFQGTLADGSPQRLSRLAAALGFKGTEMYPDGLTERLDAQLRTIRLPDGWQRPECLGEAFVASPASESALPMKPFVFDRNRLYLQRNWVYECRIARRLRALAKANADSQPLATFQATASEYFRQNTDPRDWQQVAAAAALCNQFTVITGGPGTGKTTTVAAILGLALEANPELKILLCAPTGKAQAVLARAIQEEGARLQGLGEPARMALAALQASTIHRLLKYNPATGRCAYDRKTPLEADLVVVDEVSMIQLSLMHDLLEAIPEYARIIFLGDKDQLPSIETGTILVDLFAAGEAAVGGVTPAFRRWLQANAAFQPTGMADILPEATAGNLLDNAMIRLSKSYRFTDKSQFGQVVSLINEGEAVKAWNKLVETAAEDPGTGPQGQGRRPTAIHWAPHPANPCEFQDRLNAFVLSSPYKEIKQAEECRAAYEKLSQFRILCPYRNHGLASVAAVNRQVRRALGLRKEGYQKGIPILVTANDYGHHLFNGDIGLCWPKEGTGELAVFFPDPENPEAFRSFLPQELPEHEDAFAMTIHKSQGSGFAEILIILPGEESPLLTRELLYTGLTRTKVKATLWANADIFKAAVLRKTIRPSGLKERLG